MEDGLPRARPPLPGLLRPIVATYGKAPGLWGATPRGVGWSSEQAQMLRLRVLLRLLDGGDGGVAGPVTVNDLGCGWGALWPLLRDLEHPRVALYTGYDVTPEMIALARRCFGGARRARFLIGDHPDEPADYGFVSGTFNYRRDVPTVEWEEYVRQALAGFAATCRKGMAFNLLHRRAAKKSKAMYLADPQDWLAFARSLPRAAKVEVADDYLPDDFTVFVRFGDG